MELPQKPATGSPIQKEDLWVSISGAHQNKTPAVQVPTSASLLPIVVESSVASSRSGLVTGQERFPHNLPRRLGLILAQNGKAYAVMEDAANNYALPVGCHRLNNLIRTLGQNEGFTIRKADITEINQQLQAQAEMAGVSKNVWYRVAPIPGGIEIDLGDDKHTRVRIAAGKAETVHKGSDTLFYRTQVSRPMVMPAEVGNLNLLKKYLNLHPVSIVLFIAWLTYTLAHPKIPTSKFVILVLQGSQGSGKTLLCQTLKKLIDPSFIEVQTLPGNGQDLAINAQNAHVLCYDNVREFKPAMADMLCIAATGGALTTRQLYTDAEQQVHNLHVALVLNGIHSFIGQPDLAQRCLPIELLPISEVNRRSEVQLASEFQSDLPAIQRGLFDLIAGILTHLPSAEVTNSERMIDFVLWLAAMEIAQGAPAGVYQAVYSDALHQGQLDSLLDNTLAAAVLEFVQNQVNGMWSGTPAELLNKLNALAARNTQRSREWPQNAIALSKRLIPLQAGLMTQGINIEFGRGKQRTITINSEGENNEH